jgi:hypothetical protein
VTIGGWTCEAVGTVIPAMELKMRWNSKCSISIYDALLSPLAHKVQLINRNLPSFEIFSERRNLVEGPVRR